MYIQKTYTSLSRTGDMSLSLCNKWFMQQTHHVVVCLFFYLLSLINWECTKQLQKTMNPNEEKEYRYKCSRTNLFESPQLIQSLIQTSQMK